jgi:hypothetical protein
LVTSFGEFTFDISEWAEYPQIIGEIENELPSIQEEILEDFASSLRTELISSYMSNTYAGRQRPPVASGTWGDSLSFDVIPGDDGNPSLIFGHLNPVGEGADRLPIYWRVMEQGARPNPRVPKAAIIEWAGEKLGNPKLGVLIASRIRKFTMLPQPILSEFLVLDSSLIVRGLTPPGMRLFTQAMEKMRPAITEIFLGRGERVSRPFMRGGQVVKPVRDRRGRFVRFL